MSILNTAFYLNRLRVFGWHILKTVSPTDTYTNIFTRVCCQALLVMSEAAFQWSVLKELWTVMLEKLNSSSTRLDILLTKCYNRYWYMQLQISGTIFRVLKHVLFFRLMLISVSKKQPLVLVVMSSIHLMILKTQLSHQRMPLKSTYMYLTLFWVLMIIFSFQKCAWYSHVREMQTLFE